MENLFYVELVDEKTNKKSEFATQVFESEMVRAQSEFARKANPEIAIWNEEFDYYHPNWKGDYEDPNGTYMQFMVRRHKRITNSMKPAHPLIKRFDVNDECCLTAVTIFGKRYSLYFARLEEGS